MKKFAVLLATLGLSLTLIGAGLAASFSASAVSSDTLQFGAVQLTLTDLNPGCYANTSTSSISCTVGTNLGSTGSAPVTFRITNTGTVNAADVVVGYSLIDGIGTGTFAVTPYNPAPGQYDFGPLNIGVSTDGIWTVAWSDLPSEYQANNVTVVFTVTATA